MANYHWGKICIGGPVRVVDMPELRAHLAAEFGDLDDENNYDIECGLEEGAIFEGQDANATEGHFRTLEEWLRRHNIGYTTYEGSSGEYSHGVRKFRSGMADEVCQATDPEMYEVFRWDTIQEAMEEAGKDVLAATVVTHPVTQAELVSMVATIIQSTKHGLGVDLIPALEPLTIVEEPA